MWIIRYTLTKDKSLAEGDLEKYFLGDDFPKSRKFDDGLYSFDNNDKFFLVKLYKIVKAYQDAWHSFHVISANSIDNLIKL